MTQLMKQFWNDEAGVTAIEYGLIAALIAMVIVGFVSTAGESLADLWEAISTELTAAVPA